MKKGFTLIELLVVISIIGLLASIVVVSLGGARSGARDVKRLADLRQIATALELHLDKNGSLPNPSPTCAWSSWACWPDFGGTFTEFISPVPPDPLNIDLGGCGTTPNCHIYRYCRISDTQYALAINLEDSKYTKSNNAACVTGGPNYYWVAN